MYLCTAVEMREFDRKTIENIGVPGVVLMETAGRGAVKTAIRILKEYNYKKVSIICGKGNNGGDGYVVARGLLNYDFDITVFVLADENSIKGDALINLNIIKKLSCSIKFCTSENDVSTLAASLHESDLLVDAILGTGLESEVRDNYKTVISHINSTGKKVLSLDIPSGIHSDNGQILGTAVKAHYTATFGLFKRGLFIQPGAQYSGNISLIDIGIPNKLIEANKPSAHLLSDNYVKNLIPLRNPDSHKGTYGHLLAISGSRGKLGAALMLSNTAIKSGAGLVTLALPGDVHKSAESKCIEVMAEPLDKNGEYLDKNTINKALELLTGKNCLAIGPGISQEQKTADFVKLFLPTVSIPTVIDADGLNVISDTPDIFKEFNFPCIITPHPGEMSRLTGLKTKTIQSDRINSALNFSKEFNVVTVLKGAQTVITSPLGEILICPVSNPGMASGGMGDILTGIIGAMLAQNLNAFDAAAAGVYLHAKSAELASDKKGYMGLTATDVMNELPYLLKMWNR